MRRVKLMIKIKRSVGFQKSLEGYNRLSEEVEEEVEENRQNQYPLRRKQ